MAVIPAFGFIGAFGGLQAVLSIATFYCELLLLRALLIDRSDRFLQRLTAVVLLHHLL